MNRPDPMNIKNAREHMVERHIRARGIKAQNVLQAMSDVPREKFMPDYLAPYAYEDLPHLIERNQTISQPYIVAMMADLAKISPRDNVLEIGTGSGYGAAVLSELGKNVHTVERYPDLGAHAEKRLKDLHYDNVTVHIDDGTKGLAAHAPYDAIIVTAGAPTVPEALKQQLAIGGRLVIPVGQEHRRQRMLQITREDDGGFDERDFGPVAFVPLIGKNGWSENDSPQYAASREDVVKSAISILPEPNGARFGAHFDHLASADIVLLGEATHGTSEFYTARASITKRLVEEHGFNIIAFEADWPDMAHIDGFVRDHKAPDTGGPAFARFPEWMWRNEEFLSFARWLKQHNYTQNKDEKTACYGLDLYSLQTSITAVIDYLQDRNPELARLAKSRYKCFDPWLNDPASYGRAVLTDDYHSCENEAVEILMRLFKERQDRVSGNGQGYLGLARNAQAVVNAEKYYRLMYHSAFESWNFRDRHMFETLEHIIDYHQSLDSNRPPKVIVWAHNSHIGDARETEMSDRRGEWNIGQLCREKYGKDKVALVGFGTATGFVTAAEDWGGRAEKIPLQRPLSGSLEKLMYDTLINRGHINMRRSLDAAAKDILSRSHSQRMIGVIYRPVSERQSHYMDTCPHRQFDDYVWFRETRAVTPLPRIKEYGNEAETYPFGL